MVLVREIELDINNSQGMTQSHPLINSSNKKIQYLVSARKLLVLTMADKKASSTSLSADR